MKFVFFLLAVLSISMLYSGCNETSVKKDSQASKAVKKEWVPGTEWKLVWSDEFNTNAVDDNTWSFDWGDTGWGNNELEYYTGRPENIYFEDGKLVIKAQKEKYRSAIYTSGRMRTQNKKTFQYGLICARIKLPYSQGIWPAFWLLGSISTNWRYTWPNCGEIDVVEALGNNVHTVYGTAHGPGYSGASPIHGNLLMDEDYSKDFHVYAVEWSSNALIWSVDGLVYYTAKREVVEKYGKWVFDAPFYILINMAVGGNWPKNPDDTTIFPQYLVFDWIRQYQKE